MNQAGHVLRGFFEMVVFLIVLLTFFWLPSYVDLWFGLTLSLFLLVTFLLRIVLQVKGWLHKRSSQSSVKHAKSFLMILQGFALGCWSLDVLTTFIVIDLRGIGSELNPLGWPNGILGVAIYYLPAVLFVYFLLYKIRAKESFYGAVALTAITLFMASMNLKAGLNNFGNALQFISNGSNSALIDGWLAIIFLISAVNILLIATRNRLKKEISQNPRTSTLKTSRVNFGHIWILIVKHCTQTR